MFKQGLFWHIVDPSLPDGKSKNLDFLESGLRNTYLQPQYKDPEKLGSFIIFTGTSAIDFSELESILTPKLISSLNEKGIEMYLYEPVSYYSIRHSPKFNRGFYSELSAEDNLEDIRAGELDSILDFISRTGLNNIRINTCDYNIETILGSTYPSLNLCCRDIFLRTLSLRPSSPKRLDRMTKKFWCGNARFTLHRHAVVSYLANKPGNYSWHFICEHSATTWPDSWIDNRYISKEVAKTLRRGNQALNKVYQHIDFKLPEREKVKKVTSFHIVNPPENPGSYARYNQSYKACFVAVVNETRFAQPTGNISEKVLNTISENMPFILVAPPRSLEYMRALGFKTFGKLWDESYDLEEDPTKRLTMIFKLIDEINNLPFKRARFLYKKMAGIIEHNKQVLAKLQHDTSITKATL